MKIAIEAQRVFRKKKHGMDIVALELIRHLQEIDNQNEYFILVRPDEDNTVLTETSNFRIIEIAGGIYPIWEQYYLPKAIRKIKPDILHCTSNTAPLTTTVPLVLTLHDILYMKKIDFTKGTWYQRFGNLYRRYIIPRIIHKCAKIVTVSDFEKQEIDKLFSLPFDRVNVVYNSYNPDFRPITASQELIFYKEKYNLPNRFILYLGNTHPNKNLRNVLKALNHLQNENEEHIPLVMPDVEKHFLYKILHEIGNPDLAGLIHLTGYIPNDELRYTYSLAEIFLYPSFYESFGIPILEAMACGTPVITSNGAAMPEIANDAALIVNPSKPIEIMLAIKRLLSDQNLHSYYKEAGLRRASHFTWNSTAHKMINIYEDIVTDSKPLKNKNQLA